MNAATLKHLPIVLCSLFPIVSVCGQDLIVVTADPGYLLDDDDQLVETVPWLSILPVAIEGDTHFTVGGGNLRINRMLVHKISGIDGASVNRDLVDTAFETMGKAFEPDLGYDQAIILAKAAIDDLRTNLTEPPSLIPWLMSNLAFLHFQEGELDSANEVLDSADNLLEELGQPRHLHAADVLNIRALVRAAEGEHPEAIRLLNEGLLIIIDELGNDHFDTAALYQNLSASYAAIGETTQATRAMRMALRAAAKVLPASAVEIPYLYAQLGRLEHQEEKYSDAILSFKTAMRYYREHAADRSTDIASAQLQIGDAYEMQEEYGKADKHYLKVAALLDAMSPDDAAAYRKAMLNRQGLLDFGKEDYVQALIHFADAKSHYDLQTPQYEDGDTWENIGNVHAAQDNYALAKKAYVQALKIYAQVDDENGDDVWRVDDLIRGLDGATDGSLDDVVMTPELRAYMFDDDIQFLTAIPELTVMGWNARTDETDQRYAYYTSSYGKEFGNVDATQLRSGRMLPGYFDASADDFRTAVKGVRNAWVALKSGNAETAMQELEAARKHAQETAGESSTLTLWVRIFEIRLTALLKGPEAAASELSVLRDQINSRQPGDYPIEMDAKSLAGSLLLSMNEADLAAEKFRAARDIAAERLGWFHIDVMDLSNNLAKALLHAGNIAEAEKEIRETLRIAEEVYPSDVQEVAKVRMEVSLVLMHTDSLGEALALLESFRNETAELDEHRRFMSFVVTGRVLRLMGKTDEADKALNDLRRKLPEMNAKVSPPAAMIHADLGRLAMVGEYWTSAVDHLKQSVSIHQQLGTTGTFECAATRLDLAKAAIEDNSKGLAWKQLNLASETFTRLKRTNSSEAKEMAKLLTTLKSQAASFPSDRPAEIRDAEDVRAAPIKPTQQETDIQPVLDR